MLTDRGIFVVGTGRSGTSMAAGVCHHLGVNMGDTLMHANQWNQYGYFEDMEFHVLLQSEDIDEAKKLVKSKLRLWGVKNPLLCYYVNDIIPNEGDYRVVIAHREPEDIMCSYMKAYGVSRNQTIKWYSARIQNLHENLLTLKRKGIKQYTIEFDEFKQNKESQVKKLCKFIYEGLDIKPPNIQEAVNFVRS